MYVSAKRWKDNMGDIQVIEYHRTVAGALDFIAKQPKPKGDEFEWLVGKYE